MCAMPFNRKYSLTAVVSPHSTAASVLSKTGKKQVFTWYIVINSEFNRTLFCPDVIYLLLISNWFETQSVVSKVRLLWSRNKCCTWRKEVCYPHLVVHCKYTQSCYASYCEFCALLLWEATEWRLDMTAEQTVTKMEKMNIMKSIPHGVINTALFTECYWMSTQG